MKYQKLFSPVKVGSFPGKSGKRNFKEPFCDGSHGSPRAG